MLVDKVDVLAKLRRIVFCLVRDPLWRRDMLQEGTVHLWMTEHRIPGQTTSWYLQNCRFHIQNLLRADHSLDAPRRGGLRSNPLPGSSEGLPVHPEMAGPEDELLSLVCARDYLRRISTGLSGLEIKLLKGLIHGCSTREMAQQLQVSQTCIMKHRHRIAQVARRHGLMESYSPT